MSNTPMTDHMEQHAPVGLRRNSAFEQASDLCRQLERELNAANERIEAINRGNAAAERILCDAAGVGSGRDVLEWIVAAKDRIKRLEEAGDAMETRLHLRKNISDQFVYKGDAESVENWNKAKEDKL